MNAKNCLSISVSTLCIFYSNMANFEGGGSLYVVNLDGQGRGVMFEGHHRGPSIGDAENVGMLAASG